MPTVCVVDIDTTIANNDHRAVLLQRDENGNIPQESWDAFLQPELLTLDSVQEHVVEVLNHIRGHGFRIVFLTGRNIKYFDNTSDWLRKHVGWNELLEPLLMRRLADVNVPASQCKEALFLDYIKQNNLEHSTFLFFEDDKHVMSVWRKYGLVFQCPEAWCWMNPELPSHPESSWNR
jgi:predicted secreted acid phosphatase